MKSKYSRSGRTTLVELLSVAAILLIPVFLIGSKMVFGIGGFGPKRVETVVVQRLYVDHSNESSHYMVGTDHGVFEVDNGWMLGLWNSDELYSRLHEGDRYEVTTKGNKVIGFFFQRYPYIVAVRQVPLEKPVVESRP